MKNSGTIELSNVLPISDTNKKNNLNVFSKPKRKEATEIFKEWSQQNVTLGFFSLVSEAATGGVLRPATLLKKRPGTGVFLWILQSF